MKMNVLAVSVRLCYVVINVVYTFSPKILGYLGNIGTIRT